MDQGTREWMRETIALKHEVLSYAEKQIDSDWRGALELYATAKTKTEVDVAQSQIAKCARLMFVVSMMRDELDALLEVTE